MLQVRQALPQDESSILEIYKKAQEYMIASGNPTQWGHSYPSKELVEADIAAGICRVICEGGEIHGVFVLWNGIDPVYELPENNVWRNDAPYVAIHRVASDGAVRGIFSCAVEYSRQFSGNIRIDTHHDNRIMQRQIEKQGFQKCGDIRLRDGTLRIAYQWVRPRA